MSQPIAYEPEPGYTYQILWRFDTRVWEHCDYATDKADKNHLLTEYGLAYPKGSEFKAIRLPKKYWPAKEAK